MTKLYQFDFIIKKIRIIVLPVAESHLASSLHHNKIDGEKITDPQYTVLWLFFLY